MSPGGDEEVVAEQEALPHRLSLRLHDGQPRPLSVRQDLYQCSLSHEDLVHVQQDVAALHDHPLYGQVLPDVLRLRHLVVHLAGEFLQLLPRVLQGLLLHVVRGRVGQQLVEGDDVARDLQGQTEYQLSVCRSLGTTWCIGYVKKVARECPLQAGFCSRRFKRLTNLAKRQLVTMRVRVF